VPRVAVDEATGPGWVWLDGMSKLLHQTRYKAQEAGGAGTEQLTGTQHGRMPCINLNRSGLLGSGY
jgi:hypothetical protein